MSMRITRAAYAQLIAEDVAWLERFAPASLERTHILVVLNASVDLLYPDVPPATGAHRAAVHALVEGAPEWPKTGCDGDCGYVPRGFGFECVEGKACGRFVAPGDPDFAPISAYYAELRKVVRQ